MKTALQVTVSSVLGLALIGLALFWPAGRFDCWQAWVFLGIFVVLSAIYTVYVGMKNPEVLRRRMHAGPAHESRPVQKIVSSGVVLMFFALLVVSAFDHRFGWSNVPTAVVLIGDLLVAVGLGITMLVVLQNSYAAANITVEADQKVVSTGLYGSCGIRCTSAVSSCSPESPLRSIPIGGSSFSLPLWSFSPLAFSTRRRR
jgi:uncharacterized membrane protein YidH (DUF202 family)